MVSASLGCCLVVAALYTREHSYRLAVWDKIIISISMGPIVEV